MDKVLLMIFVLGFGVFCYVLSINESIYSRATMYLKEDLEIAVHDASLALDLHYMAQGILKFDEEKALENFKQSLFLNTGMTTDDFILLDFQLFDQSNTTFPVEYEPTNVIFRDVFYSPTIIAIIETDTRSYFGNTENQPVRNVASYSYTLR